VQGEFFGDFPLGDCTQIDVSRQDLMRDALNLNLDEMMNPNLKEQKEEDVLFDVDSLLDFIDKLNE